MSKVTPGKTAEAPTPGAESQFYNSSENQESIPDLNPPIKEPKNTEKLPIEGDDPEKQEHNLAQARRLHQKQRAISRKQNQNFKQFPAKPLCNQWIEHLHNEIEEGGFDP